MNNVIEVSLLILSTAFGLGVLMLSTAKIWQAAIIEEWEIAGSQKWAIVKQFGALTLLLIALSGWFFHKFELLHYSNEEIVKSRADCLYFSIVTVSTLGYGDIHPIGFGKVVAIVEVGCGMILTGMFFLRIGQAIVDENSLLNDQSKLASLVKWAQVFRGGHVLFSAAVPQNREDYEESRRRLKSAEDEVTECRDLNLFDHFTTLRDLRQQSKFHDMCHFIHMGIHRVEDAGSSDESLLSIRDGILSISHAKMELEFTGVPPSVSLQLARLGRKGKTTD